jgi:hypothetical protein
MEASGNIKMPGKIKGYEQGCKKEWLNDSGNDLRKEH